MKNWIWLAAAILLLSSCNLKKHASAGAGSAEQMTVTMSRNAGEGMEAKTAITDNASINLATTPLPDAHPVNCKHQPAGQVNRTTIRVAIKKTSTTPNSRMPAYQPENSWMPDPFESIGFEEPTVITSRVLASITRLLWHDE